MNSTKFLKHLLTLTLLFATIICKAQTSNIELKDLKFKSIFGYDSKEHSKIYCLLGNGFFRTPSSKNSDSLINNWITVHPNAKVIQVSTLDDPKSKMTYCWLVDKTDTINNYLVKNGCFPGGTMLRPPTYAEMSDKMKSIYVGIEKPQIKVHIDKKTYDNFIEQIKAAEAYAGTNRLGIWNKK